MKPLSGKIFATPSLTTHTVSDFSKMTEFLLTRQGLQTAEAVQMFTGIEKTYHEYIQACEDYQKAKKRGFEDPDCEQMIAGQEELTCIYLSVRPQFHRLFLFPVRDLTGEVPDCTSKCRQYT